MREQPATIAKEQREPPIVALTGTPVLLVLLLAASGCAALIYEIVWFQLLQIVIGASAVSLGFLLAAYMGGMCLSSAFFARVVAVRHRIHICAATSRASLIRSPRTIAGFATGAPGTRMVAAIMMMVDPRWNCTVEVRGT